MNNIYLIKRIDPYDYDEYDGVVVVAKDRAEAINYVVVNGYEGLRVNNINCRFVGVATLSLPTGELLSSFNAGC